MFDQTNVVPMHAEPAAAADMDVRGQIRALMDADKRLTQARIATESGMSSTTLSQWLNGVYGGDNDAVESKLVRWVETTQAARAQAAALPTAPGYVETATGDKVIAALRYAQVAADIAVIYGGAGLGKTAAIKRYATQAPNVWHATMTRASANVVTALDVIVETLGINAAGGANKLHTAICKRVANTGGLLAIDEAQHLSEAALDQLRAIHDATDIGLALVGNEQVYARMTGGTRAAYLDRLFSRIGKKVRLVRSAKGDIDALLDAWGIKEAKSRADLHEIAGKPGALRIMTKVLRLASMYAAAEKRRLDGNDVRAAWRELGGAH